MPPSPEQCRVLITSALPYINGVKHLGTLAGSQLPADVFARFQRARGRETLLICATDEHGSTTELAAAEAGQDVRAFCAEQFRLQKQAGEGFALSWDHFGRSSNPQNHELTQHFARALWRNGHLEVRTTKQVYSEADKRFLPDRYVIGTCPHCGYEAARGDQCENCTRVLDPVDLIRPRSAISGSTDIEIRDSTHLFLKQSQFVPQLREWIDGHRHDWPGLVTSIAYKWLDEGLHDRGITRDVEWGVPVPDDIAEGRLKGKVFYVWFDAPIEYIAATKEWADANAKGDAWRDWWFGEKAKDVRYYEFMGKDNVPFHTVGFPVTLLGSGEPWKLVDRLKGFNWLNYYGGKFSTSGKRGVFMDTALEILPADYWRYYLMANAPEGSDSNFTWQHFAGQVNKDLADVLGNFVNRVTKFAANKLNGAVPSEGSEYGDTEDAFIEQIAEQLGSLTASLERMEFRLSAFNLRRFWVSCNEYITQAGPWTQIRENPAKAACSIRFAANLIRLIGLTSSPFFVVSANRILQTVGLDLCDLQKRGSVWPITQEDDALATVREIRQAMNEIKWGQPLHVSEVLFAKITDDQIAAWEQRFGGQE